MPLRGITRVKWVGYPAAEGTWETVEALKLAKRMVHAFERSRQLDDFTDSGKFTALKTLKY
jgi:hypothetical protein